MQQLRVTIQGIRGSQQILLLSGILFDEIQIVGDDIVKNDNISAGTSASDIRF
jgi:hypothetical protein